MFGLVYPHFFPELCIALIYQVGIFLEYKGKSRIPCGMGCDLQAFIACVEWVTAAAAVHDEIAAGSVVSHGLMVIVTTQDVAMMNCGEFAGCS